jgi:hypothetical protein
MSGPQQPKESAQPSLTESFNLLVMIAWCLSTPVEVVLHRNIGSRYLGINALGGLVLLFLFAGLAGGSSGAGSGWTILFLLLFLIMGAAARIAASRRERRGEYVHSYASGDSRLCLLAPRLSPEKVKIFVEPMAVFVAGAVLSGAAPALGHYLIAAAIGLMVNQQFRAHAEQTRLSPMYAEPSEPRDSQPSDPARAVVPSGAPAWITPELVARTLKVWQPYYTFALSPEDAVAIILGVARLFDVLAGDSPHAPHVPPIPQQTLRRPGPGQLP